VISKTNPATVIISAVSIVFIYLVKYQINERFKNRNPIKIVPVPVELIVVRFLKESKLTFRIVI
jgi:hypothetical protein